jgi:FkbM family methyltransferase
MFSRFESQKTLSIRGMKFKFYPTLDKGPMSHFYKRNFIIEGKVEVIIDVGANIGVECFRFRAMHKNAKIIAIEPSARNFRILKSNFEKDSKAFLVEGALWKSSGNLEISRNQAETHESWRLENDNSWDPQLKNIELIRTYTLGEVIELSGTGKTKIDILKIDIEGAEAVVFCEGENEWLSQIQVIIMEMPDNDSPGSFQRIMNTLDSKRLEYNSYISGENIVLIRKSSDLKMRHDFYAF